MITTESRLLLRMYCHYTNRILPYSGGLLRQPNHYVEAMEIIASAKRNLGTDNG